MAVSGDDMDKESGEKSAEDRVEEIKREANEDASSYYAQGESKEDDLKAEYSKPLSAIDPVQEQFNMMKALTVLAVGGVIVGVGFIWFMVKNLDHELRGVQANVEQEQGKVSAMETQMLGVGAAIKTLDEKFEPFKQEVTANISGIKEKIGGLQGQMDAAERKAKILRLKRAILTLREMGGPETEASIQNLESLIDQLRGGTSGTASSGAEAASEGEAAAEEAGAEVVEGEGGEEAPAEEESAGAEAAGAEEAEGEEAAAEEEPAEGEEAEEEEAPAEEESAEAGEAEEEEAPAEEQAEPEEAGHGEAAEEVHADAGHAEEPVGEIQLEHEIGKVEELPPISMDEEAPKASHEEAGAEHP